MTTGKPPRSAEEWAEIVATLETDRDHYKCQWQDALQSADAVVRELREALKSAEYAIKGREHTGFIDKALEAANRWLGRKG